MSFVEVDKEGLAKTLAERGPAWPVFELVQNALDENVRRVEVALHPCVGSRGYYELVVKDDSPDGFRDLAHAYTMFAESYKKDNPDQRGRYDMGEKLVVAICRRASIITTTGGIRWEGRRRTRMRAKTECGSTFAGELPMTRDQFREAAEGARMILCPPGVELIFNHNVILPRTPIKVVAEVTLTTVMGETLRRTARKTRVEIHELREGEQAFLYELGIPVVEIECGYHVDVQQKIPLNMDRDNVTPAYLRSIQTLVVNAMHEQLDQEAASAPWVGEALESPGIEVAAVTSIITAKHGDHRVAYDPSDPEGTKIAVTRGFQVVHGGSYTKAQWGNIRDADAILPAGQVTPSPKPFDPKGNPLKVLDESEWSDGHHMFVNYARALGYQLIHKPISVTLAYDPGWGFAAAYGKGRLTVSVIGHEHWFDTSYWDRGTKCEVPVGPAIDSLLIHEFAHDRVSDHLSSNFHEECCRLGAKLASILRKGKI